MATGDQYRRISPADLLVTDSSGAVAGIKSGLSTGGEGRMLTPAQATAVQALLSGDGVLVGASMIGGATPWTRLFGPNELRQAPWSGSAELTTPSNAVKYVTAASGANGPAMFRREGAAILIDGAVMLANTGNPNYGNYRTFAPGISLGGLVSKTIALLVYCHRLGGSAAVKLRIGTDGSNYAVYQWTVATGMLVEGWNVLLAHTDEPIGSGAATSGQQSFQSGTVSQNGWLVAAGAFANFSGAIGYVALEVTGVTAQTYFWFEGFYLGGKDKPKLTIGFDIQGGGLDQAKATMDKYGLVGYAAVPTGNGASANPQYLWDSTVVARLQALNAAGWDICQHSVSHNSMGTLSDDGMLLAEIEACREQIKNLGCITGIDLFPTPNSSYSNRLVAVAANAGVKWMRHGTGSPMLQNVGLVGTVNPLIQGAQSIANGLSLSEAALIARSLAFVDLMIQYGASGHIYTHAITGTTSDSLNTAIATFDSICAGIASRVAAGQLDVVTPSTYIRKTSPPNLPAILANPNRLQLTLGTSPYSLVNTGFRPLRFQISGGTVSAIDFSRDASTYDATGQIAGQFDVNPGDRLRITYTVAPTVIQYSI